MAEERKGPIRSASRDARPAVPPSPFAARDEMDGEEGASSHTRPITPPESASMTKISSRPPPFPPAGLPPTPQVPRAAPLSFDPSFEDSVDERTPISVTKPSLDLGLAELPERAMGAPHVVVMPSIGAGGEELFAPLPPPAVIAPLPSFGLDSAPSSGPISTSSPISSGRIPTSVAPPMPQIPKPIPSRGPIVQAPGIVSNHAPGMESTQAFPLTLPAKKQGRSPLFVAFAFAIIGGMLALAIALSLSGKKPEPAASAQEAASATAAAPAASEAPVAASATSSPAPAAVTAAPTTSATASPSVRGSGAKPSGAAVAPGAPATRPGRKTDRIED